MVLSFQLGNSKNKDSSITYVTYIWGYPNENEKGYDPFATATFENENLGTTMTTSVFFLYSKVHKHIICTEILDV